MYKWMFCISLAKQVHNSKEGADFFEFCGFNFYEEFHNNLKFVLPDLNTNYVIYLETKEAQSHEIDTTRLFQDRDTDDSGEAGSDEESSRSQVKGGNTRPVAHVLSSEDQCFMCLMKLRTGATNLDLAGRFTLPDGAVSSIILTWITYLYVVLGSVKIWPHRDILLCNQPEEFNSIYPNSVVVVHATELKIKVSIALQKHSESYSTYKSSITLKA